jgi:hypothetical protein
MHVLLYAPAAPTWDPCGPDDPDPIRSVQSNTGNKNGIWYDAPERPDTERCLDVLVVELRRAKGRNGCDGVPGREAVRDEMYGQKTKCGRIYGHGDRVGERAQIRGEKIRLMIALDVYEQRPE